MQPHEAYPDPDQQGTGSAHAAVSLCVKEPDLQQSCWPLPSRAPASKALNASEGWERHLARLNHGDGVQRAGHAKPSRPGGVSRIDLIMQRAVLWYRRRRVAPPGSRLDRSWGHYTRAAATIEPAHQAEMDTLLWCGCGRMTSCCMRGGI